MQQENRRSFVKKSLATSASISIAGLIRAHGEEGGTTTISETTVPWEETTVTTNPWEDTTAITETTTPWEETTAITGTNTTAETETTSAWNPQTTCSHQWLHYFDIQHVGAQCVARKKCRKCADMRNEDGLQLRLCMCQDEFGGKLMGTEFGEHCHYKDNKATHDASVQTDKEDHEIK